jgi:benzil reductase ((S)-benzoin forming)
MRIAVLTGASRGLGFELASILASEGWTLLEFSRTAPHPFSVPTDLSRPEAARQSIRQALADLPDVGLQELLVVHNAGVLTPIGFPSRKPDDDVLANLQANYVSGILFLTECVRRFQQAGCRKTLLNISSGAALKEYPGWSLYCAGKAGLEHFVRTLAAEQQTETFPFRAANVDPGVMDTAMQECIREATAEDFPSVGRFLRLKSDGHLAHPADVARSVLRIATLPELDPGSRLHVRDFAA